VFLKGNQKVFYCSAQDANCEWTRGQAGGVLSAQEVHTRFGYELGEPLLVASGTWFSYGYNATGAIWRQTGLEPKSRGMGLVWYFDLDKPVWRVEDYNLRKATSVKSPSDFVIIADSDANGVTDLEILPTVTSTRPIGRIHRGGANVLFLDGHVQWYLQRDIGITSVMRPEEAMKQRMWNYDNEAAGPW
jgi:prepilin-type processing-associated H-X9-DG protein